MERLIQAGGALGILLAIVAMAIAALLTAALISLWIRATHYTRAQKIRQRQDDYVRLHLRKAGYTVDEATAALEDSR